MLVKVTCTWTDLLLLRLAPHQHPPFDVKIRNGRESASLPNASCKYGLSAYFTIAEKGRIKRSTIPFYASVLFNFVSPVTQPSKHTFAKPTGLYLGDIDSGRRLRSLKSIQPFSYNRLFWEYLLVHQPYGGINHPGTHTDSALVTVVSLEGQFCDWRWTSAIMAGKGNPVPGPHLNGFPVPTYSYFFPHMLGSLSPPALPGLPISGYSTPSPASK